MFSEIAEINNKLDDIGDGNLLIPIIEARGDLIRFNNKVRNMVDYLKQQESKDA
jgi:hypothetical protein